MGFWERNVSNSVDKMLDFNGDGQIDAAEQTAQMVYVMGEEDKSEDTIELVFDGETTVDDSAESIIDSTECDVSID